MRKIIEIKKIENPVYRMTTFSRRRQALFKMADEFRAQNGGKIAVLLISPTGRAYPHGDVEELSAAMNSSPTGYIPRYREAFTGNGEDLKRWLNEIQVEYCSFKQLLLLMIQLRDIKRRIIRAEAESWTL